MDQNYSIGAGDVSLKMMSAVSVVRNVLQASGRPRSGGYLDWQFVKLEETEREKKAMEELKKLDLPYHVKKLTESLVKPVNEEICEWSYLSGGHVVPIFTPLGTVDIVRTSEAIVQDENLETHVRLKVACLYCHDKYIAGLARQLNDVDIERFTAPVRSYPAFCEHVPGWNLLASFWLYNCQYCFNDRDDELEWLGRRCQYGFQFALRCCCNFAINYFIDKVTPEAARNIIEEELVSPCSMTIINENFYPATIRLLFFRLSTNRQENAIGLFAYLMLASLLTWPYQRVFPEAARALSGHLSNYHYHRIMSKLFHKVSEGYGDCDYREMYAVFWKTGLQRRVPPFSVDYMCHWLIPSIFSLKNERIVNLAVCEHSTEEKEALLMGFELNFMYNSCYVNSSDFETFELYVRSCGMNDKNLLIRFKDAFLERHPILRQKTWICNCCPLKERDKMVEDMRTLLKIVNRIIAEKHAAPNSSTQRRNRAIAFCQ